MSFIKEYKSLENQIKEAKELGSYDLVKELEKEQRELEDEFKSEFRSHSVKEDIDILSR